MGWCFAIVNGKLAEVFFDENRNKKRRKIAIWGHCYIKRSEYKTKQEKKSIADDTKEMKIIWRKKRYSFHKNAGEKAKKLYLINKKLDRLKKLPKEDYPTLGEFTKKLNAIK